MDKLYTITEIVKILVGTIIPSLVGLIVSIVAFAKAKDKAAKEAAYNDLYQHGLEFVQNIETSFESFNMMLKTQGTSAGPMKKEQVMTRLQNYALQHGYEFDEAFWSAEIDKIVAFTREVNAKK